MKMLMTVPFARVGEFYYPEDSGQAVKIHSELLNSVLNRNLTQTKPQQTFIRTVISNL